MPSTRVLTSHNSPLQIAQGPVGNGMGMVGFTICPGKQQAQSVSGPWARDLGMDLDAIVQWALRRW